MKRNIKIIGMLILVLSFSFIFMSGCAKEQIVKDEKLVTEEEKAAVTATEEKEAVTATEEKEAKTALKERELVVQEAAAFEAIRFNFDKYDLRPEAREILREHADWLLKHTEFEVIIEGHCDERGSGEYNLALGERRAEAARDYLVTLGVDNGRLTTISYGEELPLDPSHNEDAWAKNRRDHFVVVTKKK